ncbi:retrotransposon gag domain, retroviral aspartyl protease [Tanacetum coccineum]
MGCEEKNQLDEVNSELAFFTEACSAAIQASKLKISRNQVDRDRYSAHDRLVAAYFFEYNSVDCKGNVGISLLMKCTSVIRQMTYDSVPDALDEYLQMGSTNAYLACVLWCLRDEQRRECFTAIPYFESSKSGKALDVPFVANDVTYKRGYYLTNRIYPEWSVLIKSISKPRSNGYKRIMYKNAHEATRKDVERAFDVLKKKWKILKQPARGNLSFGSIVGNSNGPCYRNSTNQTDIDPIAAQLAAIAARLESMETIKENVTALKSHVEIRGKSHNDNHDESSWRPQHHRPFTKIDFSAYVGGDPRGWILKAEKFFRFYQIPDAEKVDVASMHLEGDALNLFSWLSADQTITLWEELVLAFQKIFGPTEFQNPDEYLYNIKQTGSVQEYRQKFARRSARVSNWLENCLLGYGPGHHCKTGTFKLLEASEEQETTINPTASEEESGDQEGFAEISLHAIFSKTNVTTMKLRGTIGTTEVLILVDGGSTHNFISDTLVRELKMVTEFITPFGVQIENGDIIRCNQLCKNVSMQLPDLKIVQYFYSFLIGGADLVLGVQWLATLNTVQANWNEMFMIVTLDGKKYKLQGRHFFIRTDHYTLKFLLEQRITTIEQQRLLHELMPYDFSIAHRAGKENKGADALSRRPHSGDLFTLSVYYFLKVANIKDGLQDDHYINNIINQLISDPTSIPGFSFARQLLFYKQRMVVPDVRDLRRKLLHEAHATPVGGHGGFLKTLKRLSAQYFWPKMKQDVRTFVQQCLTCQQQKYETLSPGGLLQPLPIPTHIWEDISMDFIVGLPISNRVDTILVVVDRLSKYAHFLCLSHPFTAKGVAFVFCKEIVHLHGFPRSIISDRDVVFLSNFWQEIFDGPYHVLRKVGLVAYKLELPPDARIHPVFHVSMLKPAHGAFPSNPAPPLPITKDWEVDLQPNSVLDHRWVIEAGQPVLELLILWCHRLAEEATWENYDLLTI